MKRIALLAGFGLIISNSVFAQDLQVLGEIISANPLVTVILIVAHICLTIAVSVKKGGAWACFYFFLAPLVLFLLFIAIFGKSGGYKPDRKDIHHHFH